MITVKVTGPAQVCLNGTVYWPGETLQAPEETANWWITNGWVEKTTAKPSTKK
ncbi:hypothetical protein [Mycobacteroides chelonae]|uniref:hypothetical protein n=1 Tax=Mycobacteroides chelonae TaxID=1774 RepID=UPI0018B04618|nr:hypothetical protein [Mycobacteroides chelonae]MBF9325927.1 hypothetical protein [Mycobacteroides chelonae]MBF9420103.1 hypothetical protein [Mycobacteroides chelonae]